MGTVWEHRVCRPWSCASPHHAACAPPTGCRAAAREPGEAHFVAAAACRPCASCPSSRHQPDTHVGAEPREGQDVDPLNSAHACVRCLQTVRCFNSYRTQARRTCAHSIAFQTSCTDLECPLQPKSDLQPEFSRCQCQQGAHHPPFQLCTIRGEPSCALQPWLISATKARPRPCRAGVANVHRRCQAQQQHEQLGHR